MKKWLACVLGAVFLWGGTASAYDIQAVAAKTLPKSFTYRSVPETQHLAFMGRDIPYTMGQLAVTLRRSGRFASGYLLKSTLPAEMNERMRHYFLLNPDREAWEGLIAFNRALMTPGTPFRTGIEASFARLADEIVGEEKGKAVQVELSEFEPLRRLSQGEAYLFTTGGKVTYSVDGLLYPMYIRVYFFPGAGGAETLALLTPDEGKEPLVYAIDDLARAAAKEELLGREGYQDLNVLLARAQAERKEKEEQGQQ